MQDADGVLCNARPPVTHQPWMATVEHAALLKSYWPSCEHIPSIAPSQMREG